MTNAMEQLFDQSGGKLLVISLDQHEYGIQILHSREVVGLMDIEPVPNTPDFIRGIINLRGKVIPVIDFRRKLGMPPRESDAETCILVVDLDGKHTGVIIDTLIGVLSVDPTQFESRPDLGSTSERNYVSGIVKLDRRMITVLDMTQVLSRSHEVIPPQALQPTANQAASQEVS